MNSQPPAPPEALATAIEPWIAHMRWRPDFATWRLRRLAQEYYQEEALSLLQEALRLGHVPWPHVTMLDLGCGMGGFAVAAAQAGAQIIAVDYHRAYAQITTLRAEHHNLHFPIITAAGEALPLPSASVNAVVCLDVLEHVQSPNGLFAEIARVVRPGGVVLLTAINRYAFRDPHYHLPLINWIPRPLAEGIIQQMGRVKGGAFRDRQRLSDMHYVTWGQLTEMATRHGFMITDLDQERIARGEVGTTQQRTMRARCAAQLPKNLVLLAYWWYRSIWQATWRVALVKR